MFSEEKNNKNNLGCPVKLFLPGPLGRPLNESRRFWVLQAVFMSERTIFHEFSGLR